jgi:hypothetical protein
MKIEHYNKQVCIGDGAWHAWPYCTDAIWTDFSAEANAALVNDVIRNIDVRIKYHGTLLALIKGDRHWTPALLEVKIHNIFHGIINKSEALCDKIGLDQELQRRHRGGVIYSDVLC